MKLQNYIIAIGIFISSMVVVVQSTEMFGEYPYCTGCESNYSDSDGDWNYIDDHWCKVDDKKCQAGDSFELIAGYPSCVNSFNQAYYFDFNGEWGVENNDWCFIKPLEKITDLNVEVKSIVDLMPKITQEGRRILRSANFRFYIEKSFLDEYKVEKILLNDYEIDIALLKPLSEDGFSFNTEEYFDTTTNNIKILFHNIVTNHGYLLDLKDIPIYTVN
ncbi:hypothetical protein H8356DRAFT_1705506 [Neocallimastix lanati (nom. inval.)]|jgi:hypothetical protein|nr:hypothetical protein H8356DRAFT_1705506 [Neocallimastix sp. JGI-2020a]